MAGSHTSPVPAFNKSPLPLLQAPRTWVWLLGPADELAPDLARSRSKSAFMASEISVCAPGQRTATKGCVTVQGRSARGSVPAMSIRFHSFVAILIFNKEGVFDPAPQGAEPQQRLCILARKAFSSYLLPDPVAHSCVCMITWSLMSEPVEACCRTRRRNCAYVSERPTRPTKTPFIPNNGKHTVENFGLQVHKSGTC